MKAVLQRFQDLSIKNKLFLSYLLVLAVSSALFISVLSYITARDVEKQTRSSLEALLEQSGSFLNYKAGSIRKIMDILVIHGTIQSIVSKSKDVYEQNIGDWLLDEHNFNQIIYNLQTNPDVKRISLYMNDGMAALQPTEQFIYLPDVQDAAWMRRIEESERSYVWIPSQLFDAGAPEGTISFFRKITSTLNNHEMVGLLRADMPVSVLKDVLDQTLFTPSTSAMIVNDRGELIALSGRNPALNPRLLLETLDRAATDPILDDVDLQNEKTLIAYVPIQNTDWRLVLAVPRRDIGQIYVNARNQLLVIFVFVAGLTLLLAYYVSASGTIRIRKLIKTMRKVGTDDIQVRLDPQNSDEIGELTLTYNRMLSRIEDLAGEKFKLGLEVKSSELKALQAQINPHFLYNTLDMANWLAMKYKADDIQLVITSLAEFYKISLSNGEDIIPIRDELEHVTAYLKIQNMRFRDRIRFEIDVPDELMTYRTLKLILQPLVENSILHGIMEKDDPTGMVRIRGRLKPDEIELVVEDDGVGMEEQRLHDLLEGQTGKKTSGYGMRNIGDRLQIMFGLPYGLSVRSAPNAGTSVTLRLPVLPERGSGIAENEKTG